MNVDALKRLAETILALDADLKIQNRLQASRDAIENMANNPQDTGAQENFAKQYRLFREGLGKVIDYLSPVELERCAEFGGTEFISVGLTEGIDAVISENPATPAVVRDYLNDLVGRREQFLGTLRSVVDSLKSLGWVLEDVEIGFAEVGFTIPRSLFENNFTEFIAELKYLRHLIRLIAETQGESPEDVEVASISSSDPLIWLLVAYAVARTLGQMTGWALDQWKKVEEIRRIRAETSKLNSFSEEEIEKIFGDKIRSEIKTAIDEKALELAGQAPCDDGRRNELRNGLELVLEQFIARIERGMTVDIRYLAPPSAGEEEGDEGEEPEDAKEMRDIVATLKFPAPSEAPVFQLQHVSHEDPESAVEGS